MSALSLYTIEESLALIAETREAAEAEGDLAAVAECDKALAQYLTAEASKVNSYAALINRQIAEARECEAEAARLTARAQKRKDFVDRLKVNALEVMQRFGVKELRSATNTLRIQKNGGLQPLEVDSPEMIPVAETDAHLTIRAEDWNALWLPILDTLPPELVKRVTGGLGFVPNTQRIRKALAEKVRCPECKGESVTPGNCRCERCDGTGLVPRTIPGAKLLERGSHLRVE